MRALLAAAFILSGVPAIAQDTLVPTVQGLGQSIHISAAPLGLQSRGVTAAAAHNSVTTNKTIANGHIGFSDSNIQSNGITHVVGQGSGVSGGAFFTGGGVASGAFTSTSSSHGSKAQTSSTSTNGSHSAAVANR